MVIGHMVRPVRRRQARIDPELLMRAVKMLVDYTGGMHYMHAVSACRGDLRQWVT